MKLKQFIFAFTAMLLCFTVSVNAQVAKIGGTEYTTLADALGAAKAKTGDVTVELYEKVTLNQPLNGSFTTITFVGKDTDAEIYLDVQGYITATNKKVAFENLTLSKSQGGFIANAGFMNVAFGVYDVAEVTYTNCTFANGAYASSGKVTYDGCTFKKSWEKYGLWAYGNVDVTVLGSTFADYRGIKMYAENGADASVEKANLTVKNTNFSAVDNKPAIVLTYGESVVLEGNTYSSTGTFELDLDGKPNGVAVTSDVAPVCVNDNGACGVLVDGKIYTTVAQAAEVATAGSTVTLLHNSTETVKFPEGVTLNKNGFTANGVTVVAVAKIGDDEYATLAEAVAAAQNGETIILIADVELTAQVVIPEGKVLTLDLNGKTVNSVFNGSSTTNHIYALSNKGTLTITDSTTEGNGSINSRGIYNYGSLTLNAGAINAIDGNGGYAVNNQSGSTFVMNGGVVAATYEDDHQSSSGGYDATALKVPTGCTATLNGGTINNVCDFTYAIDAAGTLNIPETSTITVNGTHGAIAVSGGVTTINAGTYTIPKDDYSRTDNVLYVSGGSLVINGGTFIGDSDTASGGTCIYDAAGTAVVNGGTFKGSSGGDVWGTTGTTIKGGTFENLTETKHIAPGYELGANGTVAAKPVAQIGDTPYYTFAEAVAAANAGDEIVMLADATVEGTLALPAGIKLTSNGHTINGSIRMLGDLELNGPLTITGGLWVGKSGETLTATLSGDKLTASYFMFQRGTYTINANIDAVYGYLSYEGTFEVNSTIHTTGANGEVLYINGNVNLNDGAVLDSDNSVFVSNDNAVLTLKPGSKVDSNVNITKSGAKLIIDATGMAAGASANITGTVTNSGNGTIAVVGNDNLEASIVNGKVVLAAKPVAKIEETPYTSLEAAFAAATDGQTITVLVDATPALSSQRAITKAAVIDLGGKTMTLKEDDLYFGTTTFQNGTIVVDPSVKASTAVFWMFANQTLTFDNVKIVATGVTGTYLIGLDGNNSDLNLLNGSEIVVENTSALDLDIICVNASTGNDIKVENSKVNVTNIDGRVFFRGNYTVKDSEVNLAGITKAGFRIEAGQTLSIEGTSKVNIEGEPRDGGIHLTDFTSTYTKAETATVNATVNEPKVAKVGENTYRTLAQAVAAVEDGGTITLIANETFTKNNRYNNGGWWDGLGYSGDKSFTIDLANFTISQNGALNDYLMWFKNDGAKANTITLMNGTLDAGTTAYSALATSSSNAQKITVNLENINVINNNSSGAALKIRGGSELNANAGTIITGKNSYVGIEAAGAKTVVNIYEGAEIYQNGTSSYCGCLAGASGNSTINVYGGYGKGVSGGFIAMTSGGTINVEGGEWIANTDGTYANSNKSVLIAQSDKQYNAGAGNAVVNVTGGTFKGGYNCYGNKAGDAQINIKGGNFNAKPISYVADGYLAVENNGVWNVAKAAAKIGTTAYATVDAAIKAAKTGDTVTILAGTYPVPAMKAGITVVGEGEVLLEGTLSGTLENLTLKNLHIKGGNAQRWAYGKGNLVFENVTFEATSIYALHFDGIAEGTKLTYKDCTIIGWAAMGGKPESCVFDGCTIKGNGTYGVIRTYFNTTIQNCTFDVDNVSTTDTYEDGIHAVEGAKVVVNNCTNENGEMKDIVNVHGASVVTVDGVEIKNAAKAGNKYYATFEEAFAAVQAGETLTLLADLNLKEILTINKAITFDGNGKKLTSTAARAINVSGADGVTIKNLTIDAKGERAINVIQNATNVTIDNVNATAANYTVNLAASAPNAVVAISGSTLNGLCTVNVSAAGANVTVDNSTVNCNDNNTTAGESYAALCLNKEAVGGSIVATSTTVNVADGSDSMKGRNGAENGTVTINGSTEGVAVMVAVITYPNSDNYHAFATLKAAIEFAKTGDVVTLIRDVTMDYNARDAYATQAENVVIDGNGKTLTLNQKNSDWASFGLANNSKLVLKNMTIEKTGYGDTSGAWNTHAIIFSCPVEMNKVTVNNSIAVQAGATLTNVTINEANAYYGLWINGNGQTVTVNGGAINATNGGRGIKIADQYIDAPEQVTLNVTGTKFNTAKKAAVLVSSKAGANITASNVNIENVAEDKVNFVWVDEDWAEYFSEVEVTGATVSVEGADSFAAAITENGAVKGYYKTLAEALTAAADGDTVTLIWSEDNAPIAMNGSVFGKNVTITGTAKVDWSKGFLFVGRGGEGNATVTFDGANLTSASNNATYGIHVSGREKNTNNKYDGTLVIKNSTIDLDYLINKGAMTLDKATLTVKNGFATGGRPAGETESGEDATATISLTNESKLVVNSHNGMGLGYEAIGVMNIDKTSTFKTTESFLVTAKGTMNIAGKAIVAGTLTNNGAIVLTDVAATLTSSECGNVTTNVADHKVAYADGAYKVVAKNYVASIEEDKFESLAEALAAAQAGDEITLVGDVTEDVTVSKAVTIDGAGKTYTGAMTLKADATFKNVNFDGKGYNGYAITTRGANYLTIEDCTAKNYGYGFVQLASGTALTTVKNVTVSNMNYGVKVDYSNAVVLENADINVGVAALLNSNYGEKTITVKNSKLNILGTWVRNNTIKTTYVFEGANTVDKFITEDALDNFKLAIDATLTAPEGKTVTTEPGYFVQYADGVYSVCGEIAFVDGEFTEYTNAADMLIKTLTYKRKFSTSWTPFYVPFAVPVSALADQFDIAYINGVRRRDGNCDGVLDEDFTMEIIFIHCESKGVDGSGKTLKPNYPYFIRSKSGQTETMELILTDATLYSAASMAAKVYDCTTMTERFEIKGNNRKMLSNEFKSSDYIVSKDGWQNIASESYLNPFRFYMTMSSRDESDPTITPIKSMKIVVCGEEDENGATIIYDVVEDSLNGDDFIYDLQGRRVSEPKKGGIYIKNGKKILF